MGRRVIVAFAFALIALAIGTFVQQGWLRASPPPPPLAGGLSDSVRVELPLETITIVSVDGKAERRRDDGTWEAIDASSQLAADDVVRTDDGSTMELALGAAVHVRVAEATELTLGEVSRSLSRIELADGRLASVVDAGYRFRVEVRDSDATAETDGGAFAVMSRDAGAVAVAASEGTVRLSSGGEAVDVRSGQLSVAERGRAPSSPAKIPASLFLKLGRGVSVGPAQVQVDVEGTTVPGAVVRVAGRATSSQARGAFKQTVVLREGQNAIIVEVEDAMGRRAVGEVPVIRRAAEPSPPEPTPRRAPPSVDARVSW